MASGGSTAGNQDHALQVIKKYRTYVDMIAEVNIRKFYNTYESKLRENQYCYLKHVSTINIM